MKIKKLLLKIFRKKGYEIVEVKKEGILVDVFYV